ncbi:TonB-dependent receptor [Robertkochia marina]|uniref:TonB-dependent receptor n=1 Tax=Robertkochia marina TaxID=1227945 RepID=A0A4S3M5P9_9FLAO|nr:TonB-dependent receptor [Robertkochia marina]THD69547.1 TonB-dependent receptor [Robertkochia marina]TRZ47195.1 TonB-dependent receptor [Robertkochia marina]
MKIQYFLTCFLLFVVGIIHAQQAQIQGKVVESENQVPLPGVNIVIKGTDQGVATDFDGNFFISADIGDVLVFSYIGFQNQEVEVTGSTNLEVIMQADDTSLEEVVVVGYGTQKKSVVTGSISSIKAEDIQVVPNNGRVENVLQGRTSGVVIAANSGQPGSNSTVRVRGITTFDTFGGNEPLWVVDGVIVDAGGIGFINQSDIESIEVLKDAASLAIYGARSAAGVILITTKKGRAGRITVNYNGYSGVSSPSKTLNLLNATEYGAIMNEKSVADGGDILYPDLSILGRGTDWQDVIFNNNARRYLHEVSITGGNDVSSFFSSFGTVDQEGIVTPEISKYNKKNFRLNSTHKLSKIFTLGQSFGYTHEKTTGIGNTNSEFGGPLSSAINLDPLTPFVVTDPAEAASNIYSDPRVIRDADGNPYGISTLVGQEMSNPAAYVQTRLGQYGWSDNLVGNAYLEANPLKGLKFKSSFGGKLSFWGFEGYTPAFYLNPSNANSQNNLSRNTNRGFGWNIENTLLYNQSIGKHNFSVLLGQGAYVDGISEGTGVTYFNLPVTSYKDASFNFDIPTEDRSVYAWDGAEHKLTSYFSRVTYDFNEKYLFTGIVRRDGSSRFGPNKRYGTFPSFSLGWVLSNEGFWNENEVFNTFKIRGGYGITGNDGIGDFGYLALISGGRNYTYGNTGSTIVTGYSPNAPDNPDLRWEETAQGNIGFDARFLGYMNLTVDYFNKTTTGILQAVEIPGFVGAPGSPLGNVADMVNRGLEVELGYRNQWGDFNFSANGNFSYLENEVTYLGQGKEFITTGTAGFQAMGPITRTQVGQSYNSFFGFETDGIFQNMQEVMNYTGADGTPIQPGAVPGDFRWKDTNGDGSITNDDRVFLGSPLPKYTFGLTISMNWKSFDFTMFTQGAAGNKIFQGLRRLDILNANYQTKALTRWTGEGTSNDYPRLSNSDPNMNFSRMSDFFLEDGDYLRLKNLQIGYSLPVGVIQSIGAERLRIYMTGENLLTFTNYTGYDPEIGGNVLGIDRGYYPQARSFMLGLDVQF